MTLYMLVAGFAILIYTGTAFASAAVSGFSSAYVAILDAATREPGDASIVSPNQSQAAVMPTLEGYLTEEELQALVYRTH